MKSLLKWLNVWLQTDCEICMDIMSSVNTFVNSKNDKMTLMLHLTKTDGILEVHIGGK